MNYYKIYKKFSYWKETNILTNKDINYENYEKYLNPEDFDFTEDVINSNTDIIILKKENNQDAYQEVDYIQKDEDKIDILKRMFFGQHNYYPIPFEFIRELRPDCFNYFISPSDDLLKIEFSEMLPPYDKDFQTEFEKWKKYKEEKLKTVKEGSFALVVKKEYFHVFNNENSEISSDYIYSTINAGVLNIEDFGIIIYEIK